MRREAIATKLGEEIKLAPLPPLSALSSTDGGSGPGFCELDRSLLLQHVVADLCSLQVIVRKEGRPRWNGGGYESTGETSFDPRRAESDPAPHKSWRALAYDSIMENITPLAVGSEGPACPYADEIILRAFPEGWVPLVDLFIAPLRDPRAPETSAVGHAELGLSEGAAYEGERQPQAMVSPAPQLPYYLSRTLVHCHAAVALARAWQQDTDVAASGKWAVAGFCEQIFESRQPLSVGVDHSLGLLELAVAHVKRVKRLCCYGDAPAAAVGGQPEEGDRSSAAECGASAAAWYDSFDYDEPASLAGAAAGKALAEPEDCVGSVVTACLASSLIERFLWPGALRRALSAHGGDAAKELAACAPLPWERLPTEAAVALLALCEGVRSDDVRKAYAAVALEPWSCERNIETKGRIDAAVAEEPPASRLAREVALSGVGDRLLADAVLQPYLDRGICASAVSALAAALLCGSAAVAVAVGAADELSPPLGHLVGPKAPVWRDLDRPISLPLEVPSVATGGFIGKEASEALASFVGHLMREAVQRRGAAESRFADWSLEEQSSQRGRSAAVYRFALALPGPDKWADEARASHFLALVCVGGMDDVALELLPTLANAALAGEAVLWACGSRVAETVRALEGDARLSPILAALDAGAIAEVMGRTAERGGRFSEREGYAVAMEAVSHDGTLALLAFVNQAMCFRGRSSLLDPPLSVAAEAGDISELLRSILEGLKRLGRSSGATRLALPQSEAV